MVVFADPGLGQDPVQAGVVAEQAVEQLAPCFGGASDLGEFARLRYFMRRQRAVAALEIRR
ncbi:hypothetical protein FQZ97_785380 [compost metagenome]